MTALCEMTWFFLMYPLSVVFTENLTWRMTKETVLACVIGYIVVEIQYTVTVKSYWCHSVSLSDTSFILGSV